MDSFQIDRVAIDAAITQREARVAKRRLLHENEGREILIEETQIAGMKVLRNQLFDNKSQNKEKENNAPDAPQIKQKGRQPGAISSQWRHILSDSYHDFARKWFPESALTSIAIRYDIKLKPTDARNRLIGYRVHNYVEEDISVHGTWRVTETCAKKFGFFEKRLEKDKAPKAEAKGAS